MPRLKGAIPNEVRIRENQRRSRARRKELLEELQAKLQQYEREQVQATIEVQQAARGVVWENGKLRGLLAVKGVSRQEIDDFLRQSKAAESERTDIQSGARPVASVTNTPMTSTPNSSETGYGNLVRSEEAETHHPLAPGPFPSEDRSQTLSWSSMARSSLSSFTTVKTTSVEYSWEPEITAEPDSNCPPSVDCYCPPTELMPSDRSSETVSCEEAASIIAGMRGHGDREQARAELGCKSNTICRVKNTTLFQLMDRG